MAFRRYNQLFPHQYLSLALIDGLPIGDDGKLDESEIGTTTLDVIAVGMTYKHFVLQANGIGAHSSMPPYPYVESRCGVVPIGYQTHAPMKEALSMADLGQGVVAGSAFLEVYESDVLKTYPVVKDTTIANALDYAAGALPAETDCGAKTLTLKASPSSSAPSGTATSILATPNPTFFADLNLVDDAFTPTFPPYRWTNDVNVYEGASLLGSCVLGMTCSFTTTAGVGRLTFEADIGPPGTLPDTSQAIVATKVTVQRTGKPVTSTSLPCKGSDCT
jgi:hypothetical protein